MPTTHKGECFCGAVHVEVSGEPEAMGYCHCRSCRSWSGGPVNAFTLWKPNAIRITAGAEQVATFQKTETRVQLIKSTIQERRRGRQRPSNFAPACRIGLRCA